MQPEYQPWFIVSELRHMTARFGAEQSPDGQTQVSVRLQQLVKDVPRQDFDCPLSVLKQVVELAESAKDSLDYKEEIRLKEPDKFVELEDHTVKFYGRLKPSGEEQIAILIESKEKPEQGKEAARFMGDLDHMTEFAEAGQEYEELVGQSQAWRPLVRIVEPGPTRDRATARVVGLATDQERDQTPKRMSIEEAQRRADQDRSLVLWPRAMSYVPVGRLIDVQRFDDAKQDNVIESAKLTKINNAIEFVHADRERRGAGHVIGQWALPGRPEVGQKVAWSGLPQAYDGTSLDFRVDYHGHAHEKRDVPKDAPFILIRESDNTVVGVFTTKAEAVRALDTVKRDQPIEQTRARDWSQELTMPKPPR